MTSSSSDHQIKDQIQSDKLHLLFHQSYQAVFFSLIAAIIYAGIVWEQIDHQPLTIWLIILFISGMSRLILFHNYSTRSPQDTEILKWEKPYYLTLNVSSLTWGLGTVLITYNAPIQYQYISFYFLMGMAGAALGVYSSIRYFAITTIFNVLTPAVIWLILQNTQTSLLIALGTGLFLVSAIRATKFWKRH